MKSWSFGQRVAGGFAITLGLGFIIVLVTLLALRSVIDAKDLVTNDNARIVIDIEKLRSLAYETRGDVQGYLITGDRKHLERYRLTNAELAELFSELRLRLTEETRMHLERADAQHKELGAIWEKAIQMRTSGAGREELAAYYDEEATPTRLARERALNRLAREEEQRLLYAELQSDESAVHALRLIVIVAVSGLLLATGLAVLLTRTLTHLYRKAEKAVRAREDVLAIVAHDLKSPLGVIMMNVAPLEAGLPSDAEAARPRKSAAMVRRAAERMDRLIRDLLDAASIEAGHLSVELGDHEAGDIARDALELLSSLAAEKSLHTEVHIPADTLLVRCDRERILQVLSNLIGNAIKFTPEGGVISVRAEIQEALAKISVCDTGPGIPGALLPVIFHRFSKGKRGSGAGTGLGLYIADGIVRAHGGEIWAQSVPGTGSVISFTLPLGSDERARSSRIP